MARLLESVQITGQLDHSGVVPLHELALDAEGRRYCTMKLVQGMTLGAVFARVPEDRDGWLQALALGTLLRVCQAVVFAHERCVVCRDQRLWNVMVGDFGEFYVMNQGLARGGERRRVAQARIRNVPRRTPHSGPEQRPRKSRTVGVYHRSPTNLEDLTMLTEVSGDILLSKAQVIAHGVAPGDHFDSGLALALRKRFPTMYKDFRHFCKVGNPKGGGVWTWGGVGGVRVTSLFTQDPAPSQNAKPGPATVHNVSHALKEFAKEVEREGYTSIALPRLATGVGRLDWDEVKPLMERYLADIGVPVIVYSEYHADVEAKEGLQARA